MLRGYDFQLDYGQNLDENIAKDQFMELKSENCVSNFDGSIFYYSYRVGQRGDNTFIYNAGGEH